MAPARPAKPPDNRKQNITVRCLENPEKRAALGLRPETVISKPLSVRVMTKPSTSAMTSAMTTPK